MFIPKEDLTKGRCPFCNDASKEDLLYFSSIEVDDDVARQRAHCQACDAQWTEIFRFAGIVGLSLRVPLNERIERGSAQLEI